ncbi:hypothetical protein IMSAGC019_00913 [Lachnospiraceae bacterium]|nr:hypothetical protein IMSAGC019_00913 [Lachnospiraceae bacterium]
MQRKQDIHWLIKRNLVNKISFGNSKHEAKKDLDFGQSSYQIYAKTTYDTYKKECLKFADWLQSEKGIKRIKEIDDIKPYAQEYLQSRLDKGCSVWTVKMEKSALGMLYNEPIKFDMPKRDINNITRSRHDRNSHFSRDGKYHDVYVIALATGGRRADIAGLKPDDFKMQDGKLYVDFERSKGGRSRFTYVREEYTEEVFKIVQKAKESGQDKVLEEVPSNMDIHALRKEYAYSLYQDIQKDSELRTFLLNHEPPRKEYRTSVNKDGMKVTKEVQRDIYKDRDGNIFKRDDIYIISRMLGHNRIDTAICHYLKK